MQRKLFWLRMLPAPVFGRRSPQGSASSGRLRRLATRWFRRRTPWRLRRRTLRRLRRRTLRWLRRRTLRRRRRFVWRRSRQRCRKALTSRACRHRSQASPVLPDASGNSSIPRICSPAAGFAVLAMYSRTLPGAAPVFLASRNRNGVKLTALQSSEFNSVFILQER